MSRLSKIVHRLPELPEDILSRRLLRSNERGPVRELVLKLLLLRSYRKYRPPSPHSLRHCLLPDEQELRRFWDRLPEDFSLYFLPDQLRRQPLWYRFLRLFS